VPEAVYVRGMRELVRTFDRLPREYRAEVRSELAESAEGVAERAEELALAGIRNIGEPWSRMRVGVTARSVYVAPRQRSRRTRRRPNFARLLLERAMEPALRERAHEVRRRLEEALDRLGRKEGF